MSKAKDISGMRFGRLVAIEPAGKSLHGKLAWLCKCDCGNMPLVDGWKIRRGHRKSCGCLKRKAKGVSAANTLYHRYGLSAKIRGHEFKLTREQFMEITQMCCRYCNAVPTPSQPNKWCYGPYICNGIDRIDNKKGYTIENCVPCCKACNYFKRAMTKTDFITHAMKIANHQYELHVAP